MTKIIIWKSTFIRGLQCEKSLYLYKHDYKLKGPTPSSLQAVFDQGTNIGLLAQELFPNGVDATPESHFKMIESVKKTLEFNNNGSFNGDTAKVRSQLLEYCKLDTYAMVKILERLKKVWVRYGVFGLYKDFTTNLKKENRFYKPTPSVLIK